MVTRGLNHRAPPVGDRRAHRLAQPAGQPGARRDLRDRLGKRRALALCVRAPPPDLGPPQHGRTTGQRQIPGIRGHQPERACRARAAARAAPRVLVRGDQNEHQMPVRIRLGTGHRHPVQTQQQRCRIVVQARGLPPRSSVRRNTNDRRRSRASYIQQYPDATVKVDDPANLHPARPEGSLRQQGPSTRTKSPLRRRTLADRASRGISPTDQPDASPAPGAPAREKTQVASSP